MRFEIIPLSGEKITADSVCSYEWTRELSAPCDGLRLSFDYASDFPEAWQVKAFCEDELVFFGYADYQSQIEDRVFIYARSSACLLVDNEAAQMTYKSPSAGSLFAMNAKPYGFKNELSDYYIEADYTVNKGTSCFGAINDFVSSFCEKSVRISPQNELYIPKGDKSLLLDRDKIISEKRIIDRTGAISRIDYKTDGGYIYHYKSRLLEKKKLNRSRRMNLSALPPWQRSTVLKNRATVAAQGYYCAELTVCEAVAAELYSPLELKGYENYYVTSLKTVYDSKGEYTVIKLFRKLDLEGIYYVD